MAAVTSESFGTGPRRTGGQDDGRSRKDEKAVKSNWMGYQKDNAVVKTYTCL
jgi:hypothetical protein